MDGIHVEREGTGLGGLFHQIITDMKNGAPLWEDFATKATKLHACLRAAIQAIAAYLDAFQKIADAATNSRGATKEIGTALTRICLRHRAVEARVKTFTSAIMDCLVLPLQDKLEDWRKATLNLDREHAKEYKRARSELKKRSTDTLRLQKKARKGGNRDLQCRVDSCMQDVNARAHTLAETERRAVRAALLEERARFCEFFALLEPVVGEEVAMLTELSHLQDAATHLQTLTKDPYVLPPASEQVVLDARGLSPPPSPRSLGSRKGSLCSISSLNSSSSGSNQGNGNALSPGSHHGSHSAVWRSSSQLSRLYPYPNGPVASQDSGFTSQDPLPVLAPTIQVSTVSGTSTNSGPGVSTWPPIQDTATAAGVTDRPHTISSAYERGHQRPALTVYTFQAPEQSLSQPTSPLGAPGSGGSQSGNNGSRDLLARPPLPTRCSSLERPSLPIKTFSPQQLAPSDKARPSPLPTHLAKEHSPQPTYVNMHELASLAASRAQCTMQELAALAASKAQALQLPPPPPEFVQQEEIEIPNGSSDSSVESSSGYGSQNAFHQQALNTSYAQPGSHLGADNADACSAELSASQRAVTMSCEELKELGVSIQQIRRRPVSVAGYPQRGVVASRRGSATGARPPPPVRRTASISVRPPTTPVDTLPPPPAFMLETSPAPTPPSGAVAETIKALTELRHTPASPGVIRRSAPQAGNTTPIPVVQRTGTVSGQRFTYTVGVSNSSISAYSSPNVNNANAQHVSSPIAYGSPLPFQDTSSTIMMLNQSANISTPLGSTPRVLSSFTGGIYAQPNPIVSPVSPVSTPKRQGSFRSQSAERKDGPYHCPGGIASGFMAQLSARLAPQLSPRAPRRGSQSDNSPPVSPASVGKSPQQFFGISKPTAGPAVLQRGGRGFIDSLNAKLAQQSAPGGPRASVVRQVINNVAQPDPSICHESLMEQIKRGATLKRNRNVNDRSAPKIH